MRRRCVEHRAQFIGSRDFEHRIDDMPVHFPAGVPQGQTLQVLEPSRINLLDYEILQIAGHHSLTVGVLLEFLAARRVTQLHQPLLGAAQCGLAPGFGVVKQVPVRKGKSEAGGVGMSLRVDAQSFGVAMVEPGDQKAMDFRFAIKCHERLIEQRASAQLGERLDLF